MVEPEPARPALSLHTIVVILIILSLVLIIVGMIIRHQPPPSPPIFAGALPDHALTPGAIDPQATNANICAHDWGAGDPPEPGAGDETYSQAARHTSQHLKDQVFAAYHLTNPHDGGHSWEVDHLVPLSLGGRDVKENLWPESRIAEGLNAWAKDRLEYRLYRLVCDPVSGAAPLPLGEAQAALRGDWVAAYHHYCPDENTCPAFGGSM